jgi:hypothetical protein
VSRKDSDVLSGMKEICNYMNRCENTILNLARRHDFPAWKINGSWYSDRAQIAEWMVSQKILSTLKVPQNPSKLP